MYTMNKHSQITNNIFITNWKGSIDVDQLAANNIKYVLCLNFENKKTPQDYEMYGIMGIEHKYIKINDHPNACLYFHFPEIVEFMKKEEKGNVLVHCSAGISRSTTSVIAYLLYKLYNKKEINQFTSCRLLPYVVRFVKRGRSYCNPNFGFLNQLHRFETYLIRNR